MKPDKIVEALRKELGATSALLMKEGGFSAVSGVIPTGIDVFDRYILGIGGLPLGRMVEMYSEEGGGKTTMALKAVAGVQKMGGVAIYADTENKLDPEWAALHGVNTEDVVLLQPMCIEDTLAGIEKVLSIVRHDTILIVWDSLAATPTRRELEEGITGDDKVGDRSKTLSKAGRVLSRIIGKRQASLLIINQVRDKIGVMFGDPQTTPGGRAVKFHATQRIQLWPGKSIKAGDTHIGKYMTVMAPKNQLAAPWRKAKLKLMYDSGFDNEWSTLALAKDFEVVPNNSSDYDKAYAALEEIQWGRKLKSQPPATSTLQSSTDEDSH